MSPISSNCRATVVAVALLLSAPVVLAKPSDVKKPTVNLPSGEARVSKNELKRLYKKAVTGDAESQYQFSLALHEFGYTTNVEIAARWMLAAAKQGHPGALGYILESSRPGGHRLGLSRDTAEEIVAFAEGYRVAAKQFSKQLKSDS